MIVKTQAEKRQQKSEANRRWCENREKIRESHRRWYARNRKKSAKLGAVARPEPGKNPRNRAPLVRRERGKNPRISAPLVRPEPGKNPRKSAPSSPEGEDVRETSAVGTPRTGKKSANLSAVGARPILDTRKRGPKSNGKSPGIPRTPTGGLPPAPTGSLPGPARVPRLFRDRLMPGPRPRPLRGQEAGLLTGGCHLPSAKVMCHVSTARRGRLVCLMLAFRLGRPATADLTCQSRSASHSLRSGGPGLGALAARDPSWV